ncbi:GNAT family N-acetyltransferase [Streptomyces sp. NPDC058045]|uniref:GNAT family N-acetyltransferase n=1 Tax=Streptomyces sp. NPDC058045 TaxID=3346311 RepID=UPI0036EFCB3B
MTTTLRPTEPLQRSADGQLSRHYQVCVNSRPVGAANLSTHPDFGPEVARLDGLRIAERERRRGRGTVAVLAAEEVARGWGCRRIEASIPAEAEPALRLAAALGYLERNRGMSKPLPGPAPALPEGTTARPMTPAEFGPWQETERAEYAQDWISRGVSAETAHRKARQDHEQFLPHGLDTEDALISVLEHRGEPVGTLWLRLRREDAFVLNVEVAASRRGEGHGRSLLRLAEAQTLAADRDRIGLNVFTANTPALRLYQSLGYHPTRHHYTKDLI